MATRMQQRRGTASQWTTVNPVLAEGEIGLETDTNKFKIGNGVNDWSTLAYASLSTSDLADYATTSYVDNAINTVVGLAPETLDTLAELATALGDDPNAITTIQSDITTLQTDVAGKADSTHNHTLADVTDVTATATEVNVLDGITATTAELNYTDGVTSSIQTQLDAKAPLAQTMETVSTSRALTDADSGKILLVSNGITITAAGLNPGERVDFINQDGSTITFAAGGMAILESKDSATTLTSQIGAATLICWSPGMHYYLVGDLA